MSGRNYNFSINDSNKTCGADYKYQKLSVAITFFTWAQDIRRFAHLESFNIRIIGECSERSVQLQNQSYLKKMARILFYLVVHCSYSSSWCNLSLLSVLSFHNVPIGVDDIFSWFNFFKL